MPQIVITGASAGISISTANQDPGLPVSITQTGAVTGTGIYGDNEAAWQVVNLGHVSASTGTHPAGIRLKAGGTITNGSATVPDAQIYGSFYGIDSFAGTTVDVTNYGTVGGHTMGIRLNGGGTVTNGTTNATAAQIQGYFDGVRVTGGAGTIANDGTITGTILFGIVFDGDGVLHNGEAGATGAIVQGGSLGILAEGNVTIGNAATIEGIGGAGMAVGAGGGAGIQLVGGTINNGTAGATAARIEGTVDGIYDSAGPIALTVTNAGTIAGDSGSGVYANGGGTITNGGSGAAAARIEGDTYGVADGVGTNETIRNGGTITGTNVGIRLFGTGTVTNGLPGALAATIYGGSQGIYADGGPSTITNAATITSPGDGIRLGQGTIRNGSVTNRQTQITGGVHGVFGVGVVTIDNFGTISGGVYLGDSNGGSRIIVHAGSRIVGGANAGPSGNNTVEFAASGASTLNSLHGVLTGFRMLAVDSDAGWHLVSNLTLIGPQSALDGPASISLGAGGLLEAGGLLRTNRDLTIAGQGELRAAQAGKIEIGSAGGAAAGVITVDANRTLAGTGLLGNNVVVKGTIIARPGTLAVLGGVSGPGTIEISPQALFLATGTIGSSTRMQFLPGTSETLAIGTPGPTIGVIGGFGAGDTIDLMGIGLATAVLPAGGGVFNLSGLPGGPIGVHFAGFHDAAAFQLAGDGHGGTLLTYL